MSETETRYTRPPTSLTVNPDYHEAMRRTGLRNAVLALEVFRDKLREGPSDIYEKVAVALMPLTDSLLHELRALEGGAPYPHPISTEWWDPEGLGWDHGDTWAAIYDMSRKGT